MSRPHSSPPSSEARATPEMATVVITADHVYLPLDENGDGTFDWAVSNVSTTKVVRRSRLKVPVDLACFLSDRDQAEIVQ